MWTYWLYRLLEDPRLFAIGIPLFIAIAAVGRTVLKGPSYTAEKAATKWLLNVVLLIALLACAVSGVLLWRSVEHPRTVFDMLDDLRTAARLSAY